MGWAAYRIKRFNNVTGEQLGEFTLFFPKVSGIIEVPAYEYSTIDSLLATSPDYPIESSIITYNKEMQEALKTFGFGNAITLEGHIGEKWVLNNGSYFIVSQNTSGNVRQLKAFLENGEGISLGGEYKAGKPDSEDSYCSFLPFLIGENSEGSADGCRIGLKISNKNKFYYNGHYLPQEDAVYSLKFFAGAEPIYETSDPYGNGGESGTGGGTGSFDGAGDDISIPSLPTLSAVDAGFITLFNPTLSEMNNLASFMWSDLFDVDGWKKIFADPMSAILGLSIVPVNVPASGTKSVKVGNISTGVSMTFAASQYVEVDCGTLNVNEYWGAYLDYDPYTKAELYLPYIGIHPISTDDIMNKPVHVVYHVDILSGACCAYVQCGGSVLYSFIGQCASSIPITGDNWTNVINGAISIAGSIGSMVATGGASAPMAIGQIASTAVNTMKPTVEKSGAMGGTGGMLGAQTPYLILTRPRQALPRDQNSFIGYPSFITEKLGDLSGYTEIDSIHLENVPATEPELSEIESLLKSGVIL